jgi:hypothetical protein
VKREELDELHYISDIRNIRSIMTRGILSHRRAEALDPVRIDMREVQDLRKGKRIPGGRPLHDYANLYVCARNPMMYKRKEAHRQLCVLRVSTGVLDLDGVIIADRNAATSYVRFGPAPGALEILDGALIFAEYWTHPGDPIRQRTHKAVKCAEVLVPDRVDPVHILGAYVSCEESRRQLAQIMPHLPVAVDTHLFFR